MFLDDVCMVVCDYIIGRKVDVRWINVKLCVKLGKSATQTLNKA